MYGSLGNEYWNVKSRDSVARTCLVLKYYVVLNKIIEHHLVHTCVSKQELIIPVDHLVEEKTTH
jgi:hypothetical protein